MHTISINLKPYIRDYVIARFGPEPIRFSKGSDESLRLLDLLARPPAGRINRGNTTFKLPYSDFKDPRVYNYLSENSIAILSKYLANIFWHDFRDQMRANERTYPGILHKDSINMFIEKYAIHPDNIEFETLKKHYYRHRKKRINHISHRNHKNHSKNHSILFGLLA